MLSLLRRGWNGAQGLRLLGISLAHAPLYARDENGRELMMQPGSFGVAQDFARFWVSIT
jgi:hypothetical protein